MSQVRPSEIVNKICKEAENFDSKDRLLNFSTKGEFQTPLLLEQSDLFYEKWLKSNEPLSFDTFLPISQNLNESQKIDIENKFKKVLQAKAEDFLCSDLYLLMGFLKWDGNALAPSVLVPIDVSPNQKELTLSPRGPIENVILKKRLEDTIEIPKIEDAIVNGKFSILLYFSLFEKAIAAEKKWKFTRHGLCLAFFNTNRMLLKKRLERGFNNKQIDDSCFLNSLLGSDGFKFKESVFEEADFDQVFNPSDHYFLYPTDSHTTKVTIDALDENSSAYAIQSLPGTAKINVVANIVAESVAKEKRTLVVSKRAISKLNFNNALFPKFRSKNNQERSQIERELRKIREDFATYYGIVNKSQGKTTLANILNEFHENPATKTKFPELIFKGVSDLNYEQYKVLKDNLEELIQLYFEQNGIEARKSFEKINAINLNKDSKETVASELKRASSLVNDLKPIIEIYQEIGLFPTGIYLSSLTDLFELIKINFNENTPDFERWDLRSNNWIAYRDTLKALPEAGDKWVRYRRQTSDIYTDNAVDENIYSTREEFAASLKATLKGLSDHYRNSRKKLLKVLRNPKSISSDAELLDLIDTLIELQDNKRAYKDSSVLGAHMLGIDWLYEKSDWVEINNKIQFIYNFRETHKNDSRLDYLLLILENWHKIKSILPEIDLHTKSIFKLTESIRNISKILGLETPLEGLCIDKWLDEINNWNSNWNLLDIHVKLSTLLCHLSDSNCSELVNYASDVNLVNKELARAFGNFWSVSQIKKATKECPELFGLPPKEKSQKGKKYRILLDEFSNANFDSLDVTLKNKSELLRVASLHESYNLDNEFYDVAIILDADCITVAEAFSTICIANKVILVGDPHMPSFEPQVFDAFPNILPRQSSFFSENILAAALRKGIPTRELWFTNNYNSESLVNFANAKIYNQGIKQLPKPFRDTNSRESLKIVENKIDEIAKTAIQHVEKYPGQTLGIIAFNSDYCVKIESTIRAMLVKDSPAEKFFNQTNSNTCYFIKAPDRSIDKYRDRILVCIEFEGNDKISSEKKLALCSTLAKKELQVFVSQEEIEKHNIPKANLFWEWITYLQKKPPLESPEIKTSYSPLSIQVLSILQKENIQFEKTYAPGGIPVGPVIVDANNSKRFLALVEDDCTTERFRESIEDREYIRPKILKSFGWKVISLWLPFWYMAEKDEIDHLVTTIAIEQSVAPPPPEENTNNTENITEEDKQTLATIEYQVVHPKIEGTHHEKPIAELSVSSIITQLKFYIDHESPIHEELLLQRILELHRVDRAGPMISKALNDAIKMGFQNQKFFKTGKFFYSIKNPPVELRNRSNRPDSERKMSYVSPEERALLPSSMDELAIKQTLGLIE